MLNFISLAAAIIPVTDEDGGGSAVSKAASQAGSTAMNFISNNNDGPTKIIYDYISAFGGVIIAFAIIMAAIKLLLSAHKKDAREKAMDSLGKIIIGGFIIGASLVFSGFIANVANQSGVEISTAVPSAGSPSNETTSDDKGSFVLRAVTDVVDIIPNKLFDWIGSGFGFKSLDNLIFNADKKASAMPPFTESEWHNLNYLYISICTLIAPLLLIMVAKTGIEMVIYSDSTSKKIDLKEEISRWILCAFMLGTAPFLIQGLFSLFNAFTDSLGTATAAIWGNGGTSASGATKAFGVDTFKNLTTGSALTTAIVHFLYAWQMIKINLVFISRKVVLAVMYAFTPIAIALWGINKRVHAASIWFGEILTNAAMQFFYAFTFTVMIVALGGGWKNWILTLVWMSAIIKISDMLRNSLQGFFTKLAGIDEQKLAGGVFGTVGSTFAGMTAAFGMSMGNKEFKGSSVGGKVLGETLGNNSGKKYKAQGNDGIAANMPPNKGTPNVKAENSSSPIGGAASGGLNPNGTSSAAPDFTGNSGSGSSTGGNTSEDLPPIAPASDDNKNNVSKDKSKEDPMVRNFRKRSNEQGLYNSMLADNLNREMAKSSRKKASGIVTGAMRAMTMNDPMMKGFIEGAGNIAGGIQKRRATTKAINKTAEQMQQLTGMSKKDAINTLFAGDNDLKANFKNIKVLNDPVNKVLDKTVNTKQGKAIRNFMNKQKFAGDIARGNNEAAAMDLAAAQPFNKLSDENKTKIIAQTNSYTSMDGFNHWED
ncbi:G protein-coupled receptor family protein [Clostridium hydrogenum]|uniref:hypothetical protein n=1 Tax=Clostridium hydrogenum TaxID=2855764 RepID=UPI001F443C60|nr:hypothetical protein [Clostridium hydrogenum]